MPKQKQSKFSIAILVFFSYIFSCFVVGVIASAVSIFSFLHAQYGLSKVSSVIARGALLPYIQVSKHSNSTFFLAWEQGLLILEKVPNFANQTKQLQKTFINRTPLDTQLFESIEHEYSTLLYQWAVFQQLVSRSSIATKILSLTKYPSIQHKLQQNAQLFQATDTFLHFVSNQFAADKSVNLVILFQNNMELRPTGGFPGSYATVHLAKNEPIGFEIQDIYVPDGQLQGHVDPPLPIQEAFQQGFWKLRDANWHPDFQESAKSVQWFFTEAGYPSYDGIVGINFTLVQKLLEITGPVLVTDLNTTVSTNNIYQVLQRDDDAFFAGSTKKKDTLSSFATQFILQLQHLTPLQYLDISALIRSQLKEKNILIAVSDPDLNSFATLNHWDGRLTPVTCSDLGCTQDYFAIFEANLGVNKSNCCVKREVQVVKTTSDNRVIHTVTTIHYQNLGPGSTFQRVAGDYKAFIRLYFPINTLLAPPIIDGKSYTEFVRSMKNEHFFHPITSDGFSWGDVAGLKELGMWIEVPNGKTLDLRIETDSKFTANQPYSLVIQKQPGTLDMFNQFNVQFDNQQLFSSTLTTDFSVK